MERKLAHIEIITDLRPIEGADRIEVAQVLGWECVVKKGEFKVGEKVIYIEVDSVMPDKPEFEFLRERNFRIKTIKLKGQISQGLVLPTTVLKGNLKYWAEPGIGFFGEIGNDVTEALGITKYLTPSEIVEMEELEKSIQTSKKWYNKFKWIKRFHKYKWFRKLFFPKRKSIGNFPSWISKTDEERIQNMPKVLEKFGACQVYVTEKIDYQSVTFTGKQVKNSFPIIGRFLPKKYQFIICSRNGVNNNSSSLYHQIAKKYNIEQILRENPDLTIQGEQGNTKVQGNKYKLADIHLWVFNIINHKKNYHFNFDEMREFCGKYNLDFVPLVTKCKLFELGSTVAEVVEKSKGNSVYLDIPREGIVVRCIESGKKVLSFKVINPDFLLKYEKNN